MSTGDPRRIWECKIGEVDGDELPSGSDGPMRAAVVAAYQRLTGHGPTFTFSGWGGRLTEMQRAVVEDREPDPASFVPEVEAVERGSGDNRSRLYIHVCGHAEWIGDRERDELGGGCDACESGSDNPLDWSPLYRSVIR